MLNNKRILAVVPARGGSKGIRLKNLREINGKPMVALAGLLLSGIACIDRSVVSTDHAGIKNVAENSGLDAPFLRPEALSGDRIGDLEVLTHALLATEKDDGQHYDVVVMVQPTCPLRKAEHVVGPIERLISGNLDAVWTVSSTDSKAHPLKQLIIKDNKLEYFDQNGGQVIARQQLSPLFHRNGAAYAITRECLLEKKSIKGDRTAAYVIEEYLPNIDTEIDISFAEFYVKMSNKEL